MEPLPLSTRVEVTESVSGGKIPIRFDAKQAIVGYFKNRGTFRDVVDGASMRDAIGRDAFDRGIRHGHENDLRVEDLVSKAVRGIARADDADSCPRI